MEQNQNNINFNNFNNNTETSNQQQLNNHNMNNIPPKKNNLGLIIGITLVVAVTAITGVINLSKNNDLNQNVNENNQTENTDNNENNENTENNENDENDENDKNNENIVTTEKGKYSIKSYDNKYRVYFDMNDEFELNSKYDLTNATFFSNNKDITNDSKINIFLNLDSTLGHENTFEIAKDSFYEDSYNYKDYEWNDKINKLEINKNQVQYVYGKYTENNSNNVINIETLINLDKDYTLGMTIYMTSKKDFDEMESIEDVLKKILNTNFVIEETNE